MIFARVIDGNGMLQMAIGQTTTALKTYSQTCEARLQEGDSYHGRLDWRQRRSAHRLDAHLQTFRLTQHGARRPAPAAPLRRAHEVINALLQARHLRNRVTYISVQYALLLQAHMLFF